MNTLKEIWEYRTMIVNLVRRDLKGQYKGSVLGFFWTFFVKYINSIESINPIYKTTRYPPKGFTDHLFFDKLSVEYI